MNLGSISTVLKKKENRPEGFMVWAGISSHGKTSLRFVKPGAKINSDYYINNILKPFLSHDVPRLFSNNEKKKMIFHQDSVPSYVSKKTIAFLNESKINYVKPSECIFLEIIIRNTNITFLVETGTLLANTLQA
jgi:Fe-S cluster assembly iron-binding protein IscA